MEISIWILLLIILIVGIICPILGRIFYKMENKIIFFVYLIVSIILTIVIYFLTSHPNWDTVLNNIEIYFQNLVQFKTGYVFSFIVYILAGFGIIGGTLEYVGEQTESAEAYKKYKWSAPIVLYFSYLVYGYIFIFAVYSFSQFLTFFFLWEYPVHTTGFEDFILNIQFHSTILVSIGIFLFTIKAFRFGIFSFEFYRSEFHPSVANIGPIRKEIRRNVALIMGAIGLFVSIWIYVIENYTPNDPGVNIAFGKSFFFFAASIEAILFYLLKDRFVDQLKPMDKQYEIKVSRGPLKSDIKDNEENLDNELKFKD
ncbi:hypothetical protein [Candidatus Harpocratesius sp.]